MVSTEKLGALREFRELWRLDDAEWLRSRKEQWRYMRSHNYDKRFSASDLKQLSMYFLYGELDDYVNAIQLYVLAPINSPAIAGKMFDSAMFKRDRWRIASAYFGCISQYAADQPWLKEHVRSVVDGVYARGFEDLIFNTHSSDSAAPNAAASLFVSSFYVKASRRIFESEFSYHAYIEGFEFILSCFPYATDERCREIVDFDDLFVFAKEISDEEGANDFAKEFAGALLKRKDTIAEQWNRSAP